MTTAVLGGAGFIGVHVVDALLASGRRVVVFGRRPTASPVLSSRATYVSADYGNAEVVDRIATEFQEILHLAYATVPQASFSDPVDDLVANVPPAVRLLQAAASAPAGPRVVVISSGGTVYGEASRIPIQEADETHPLSPYGITKLAIEKYAGMFHRTAGLDVVIVRPANAYGPHQVSSHGQGFIAAAIDCIRDGRPVTIFGSVGTVRDYVYVTDVASAVLAALERGRSGDIYNIGTGIGHTNSDVLRLIARVQNTHSAPIVVRNMAQRPFDVAVNVLDSTKLTNATGWRPAVSLDEGLRRLLVTYDL